MNGIVSTFISDNKKSKMQNSTYSVEVCSVLITGYPSFKNNNNTSTTTKKLKLVVSVLAAHPQRRSIGDIMIEVRKVI